jgi:hypothetical protein
VLPRHRRGASRLIAAIGLLLALGASPAALAQPAPTRRATTLAALVAYPVFYQGQPVLVRGILTTEARGPVLTLRDVERPLRVIFRGASLPDGPVELRGTFWDIGRLQQDDPRVEAEHLRAVLGQDPESPWPHPGDVFAMVVSNAAPATPFGATPTLREVALEPTRYVGQRITINGQFRGRNLYGDLPQAPSIGSWDFVLRSVDAAVWITGQRPRGKGFDLDVGARVDTGHWLEATGVVREGRGLVWLEEVQIALSKPPSETTQTEAPEQPAIGPAPEVIFSDPSEGETDVPRTTTVRIQFSRDMNADTFKDRVQVARPGSESLSPAEFDSAAVKMTSRYDPATRSLAMEFAEPFARFQIVRIRLREGITATDGAPLQPWMLTFTASGR